jgi:peptidoglycan/LPS O-acetylase OafA/YrhL
VPDQKELTNFDLLRAVAVLCVLFSHLPINQAQHEVMLAIGHTGALLFFLHTTFVLMLSLERLHASETGSVVRRFYIRRCFRIYPLAMLAVTLVVTLNLPVGRPCSGSTNFLENFFLLQNIRLIPQVVLDPLWSLPYEVQMYLIFPGLYAVITRTRGYAQVGVLFAVAMFLQRSVAVILERAADLGHLLLAAPWFLLGVATYGVWRARRFRIGAWVYPLALFPFCGMVSLLEYLHLPSWILGCAFAFLLPHFDQLSGSVTRVAHLVAKYSYGIYLAHVPILWFAFTKLHGMSLVVQVGVGVSLLVAIPVALYHWIEEPMIKVGVRLSDRLNVFDARSETLALLPKVT